MASNKMELSLAEANNEFGLTLHLKLAEEKTNIFFSPFSLSVALAMLYRGAKDETANEIKKVLCFERPEITDEQIHCAFNHLLKIFMENRQFYTLSSSNVLAVQKNFSMLQDYKSDLQSLYEALVLEVDFALESSAAVDQINQWVHKNTNGKIPSVFKSLESSTVAVLLNAIYFKGTWQHPFNPKYTSNGIFFNQGDPDRTATVPMMKVTKSFLFVEKEAYKVLELPYMGKDIAMLLFLPHELGGLGDLERSLSGNFVQTISKELVEVKVDVKLPKLHLEYSKEMLPILKALGMAKVFECGANLKGLSKCEGLSVSQVVHKAVLDVNEEGSEAAAVTAIAINCRCLIFNPVFNADHPFLFVIYDKRNNLILFMGRVEEM